MLYVGPANCELGYDLEAVDGYDMQRATGHRRRPVLRLCMNNNAQMYNNNIER